MPPSISDAMYHDAPATLDEWPDSQLLNDRQAAGCLGIKPGTLAIWRSTGRYALPYVKVGRLVRYRVGDLRDFIATRTRQHTGAGRRVRR